MKRTMLIFSCILLAGALLVPAVDAHFLSHPDADDVRGRLDLRRVSLVRDGAELDVTVRTHERFRDRDLLEGGFSIHFDSRGARGSDFSLRMDLNEGRPWCTLSDRQGFSRYETKGTRGRRSFACSFARAELKPTRHIHWRVRSGSNETKDLAPDQGWFRH